MPSKRIPSLPLCLVLAISALHCGGEPPLPSDAGRVSSRSELLGTNYHVAKTGQDSASGDSAHPFLTIGRAAQAAQPGDTITVHAGVYRERVTPPRGGTASQPITYEAAAGESVSIKGSEQINTWTRVSGGTYSVTLPDSYFGDFNPYTLTVSGDYLSGTFRHRGSVYLNGEAYYEVDTLDAVKGRTGSWSVAHSGTNTTISANFGSVNPNQALAEINVRPTIFFPAVGGAVDYIVVRGFIIEQAATNWAPPNAQIQEGAIGSLGGSYWTIENSTIRYSRNVGISFGVFDGGSSSLPYSDVGHHLVRNNVIQRCGQAGIAGSYLISGSRFVGNLIEDINYLDEWFGYEQANIKFHNAADLVLEGNLIRQKDGHVIYGVWADWANTNTRFTRNVIHGFDAPYQLEENHGPMLFDNNIFIGGQAIEFSSRGVVGVHNLYVGVSDAFGGSDTSRSPRVGIPHTHNGSKGNQVVDNKFDDQRYNDVYVTLGYPGSFPQGSNDDYNLNLAGAQKSSFSKDTHGKTFALDPKLTYVSDARGFAMSWDPGTTLDSFVVPLLTSDTFGVFQPVGMRVENIDGSTIVLDRDFFGRARSTTNPRVGPFATESALNNARLFDATTKGASATACVPTTCAAAGKNCGTVSDGCGGSLSCGSCTNPSTCGGGGTPNVCGAPSTNAAPTVASAAAASPSPITSATTSLSALGADDGGEGNLTYTWQTTGTPPAAVTFSANGNNGAKSTTATFNKAGNYAFSVTIRDQAGLTAVSSVNVTVNQTLTSVAVAPANTSVPASSTQAFGATANDQFGNALAAQPAFTWSVSGGGTINSSGLLTASATAGGPFVATAAAGSKSGSASFSVTSGGSTTGTITGSVAASSAAVNLSTEGTTDWASFFNFDHKASGGTKISKLTVLGGSPGVYSDPRAMSWTGGTPTATANNSVNGYYVDGLNNGWSFTVPAGTNPSTLKVYVAGNFATGTLTARLSDGSAPDFSSAFVSNSGFSTGVFTVNFRSASPGQTLTVFYKMSAGMANIGIKAATLASDSGGGSANSAPTVASAAAATPSPVTSTTTSLSALGADDGGAANLTYTWESTGSPPAPVTFSANGNNGAKNTTAAFTKAGNYGFNVTIRDQAGLSTVSSVNVTVNQTLTSVGVTPASSSIAASSSQLFSATGKDQFGNALATQPTFTWSVSGGGTINSSGAFTASTTAGGPFVATATSGGKSGTASFNVTAGGTGALTGSVATSSASVNLSTEGTTDWASFFNFDHKAGGGSKISNLTILGGSPGIYSDPRAMSWTGGTPTATANNSVNGYYVDGLNSGWSFTVPAGTATSTLRVYVASNFATGTLSARLSDSSAPDYSGAFVSNSGFSTGVFTVNFRSASPGQTLAVSYKMTAGMANIGIKAATLQ